jgi:hypothetical protein
MCVILLLLGEESKGEQTMKRDRLGLSSYPVWLFQEFGLLAAWLMWGSMGVLDYDGLPKAALSTWNLWRARPIETVSKFVVPSDPGTSVRTVRRK